MAYKVFTNASTLQASQVNDNLMNQAVATFSNEAARTAAITSPVEGQLTYLEDTNTYYRFDGSSWVDFISYGAWTTYTPTLTGTTLGNGTMLAKYSIIGKTMKLRFVLTFGSTTTHSGTFRFSLPSGVSTTFSVDEPCGTGTAIIGPQWSMIATVNSSTTIKMRPQKADSVWLFSENTTATTPATWTTGSKIAALITLEIN